MISEKFDTQTVAVYNYTIRKRTTADMPQIKTHGMTPLPPIQASAYSFPLLSLKITRVRRLAASPH